mmetsp:Transcript_9260/g.11690  ORF Transcript_9260/g.11690 Transcript_9260/m.11690 type:complete len:295 (+) Transcript_9260:153-1037(+)
MINRFISSAASTSLSRRVKSTHLKTFNQQHNTSLRYLSTNSQQLTSEPPSALNKDMAVGIQNATMMYIKHGIGKQRLAEIAKEGGDEKTLVHRWQRMMETFLGTQVHVLAGLGYAPNETGLNLYNSHVAMFMQTSDPDTQENIRIGTRDVWRCVLSSTFNISMEEIEKSEMTIAEARNAMHKVSLKMQSPETLEIIAKKCSKLESTGNDSMDMAMKHQIVQDTLVSDVYLGGNPSLVEDCGFHQGEKGYVFMQCIMAEHQNDPLISQYIGTAMMQILKSAGIDLSAVQAAAGTK